jgi:hypothetical protein
MAASAGTAVADQAGTPAVAGMLDAGAVTAGAAVAAQQPASTAVATVADQPSRAPVAAGLVRSAGSAGNGGSGSLDRRDRRANRLERRRGRRRRHRRDAVRRRLSTAASAGKPSPEPLAQAVPAATPSVCSGTAVTAAPGAKVAESYDIRLRDHKRHSAPAAGAAVADPPGGPTGAAVLAPTGALRLGGRPAQVSSSRAVRIKSQRDPQKWILDSDRISTLFNRNTHAAHI